jgi:uncharacterized damage-inducible protein DinB
MTVDIFHKHFEYTFYTDRLVWDYVMKLTDDQFYRPNTYSLGSVHEQVVHMMTVQEVWLARIHGQQLSMAVGADFPQRDQIRAHWDTVEDAWRSYLARLDEPELRRVVVARTSRGDVFEEVVWEILLHVVNHTTDHRAQLLAAMHAAGGETVAQDWIFFSRKVR